MAHIAIFHLTPEHEVPEQVFAYSYESERMDLDEIFRDNNLVEGDELPAQHETRSLSVGDEVRVDGRRYLCLSIGWWELN